MPFKEEVYISGKNTRRIHMTYRVAKVENLGVANLTEKEIDVKIAKRKTAMKKEVTEMALAELTPKKVEEPKKVEIPKKATTGGD